MPQPDLTIITEVQLYCAGFTQYKTLAAKLAVLFRMLQTQVRTYSVAYIKRFCWQYIDIFTSVYKKHLCCFYVCLFSGGLYYESVSI